MSTSKTNEGIADVLNLESTCTDPLCVVTAFEAPYLSVSPRTRTGEYAARV
jgi:hypothetical protein